jgi:hypothetical protein
MGAAAKTGSQADVVVGAWTATGLEHPDSVRMPTLAMIAPRTT